MNHLTHQKLGTDCAECEGLMPGCCSGSTGHAGPVGSPAGLLSLLFLPKEGQGKCVTAPSLDSSCRLLECGDRGLTNIQVVIQPQEWKWEEGTDRHRSRSWEYPWIPQKRHESESEISRQIGETVVQTVFEKPVFFRRLFHQYLHEKPATQSSLGCYTEPAGERCIWGKRVACRQSSKRGMELHYSLLLHSHIHIVEIF